MRGVFIFLIQARRAGLDFLLEEKMFNLTFFVNSILLGIGLAMDAFSVSLANGLNEPKMKGGRVCGIAGIFSLFQFAMPMIGWICVSTVAQYFAIFEKCIPWIALILLGFIGGKTFKENSTHDAFAVRAFHILPAEIRA